MANFLPTQYARSVTPDGCTHTPEPHVVYAGTGYRAQLRCRCGQVRRAGRRVHATYIEAEVDSKDMVQA